MFKQATLRLTGWYLLIIMLISLLFSVTLYQVSTRELGRELRLPPSLYLNTPNTQPPSADDFESFREARLEESSSRIIRNLTYFNLLILLIAGGASYFLARRTLQPIEGALEAQSRFTANASHELRTPLTAMETEIEVALRDPKLTNADARALLQSNLEEVNKLRSLSNGLLKLARYQNGLPKESLQIASLKALIDGARAKTAKLAREKTIKIETKIRDADVEGDPTMLTELVGILLDNAVKYSPSSTTVHLEGRPVGHKRIITVRDEGAGIGPSDLPHIFDRFYRADLARSKGKADGYGLGLSIAKQIADLHRGQISVRSIPGKGSTFKIVLPARQPKLGLPTDL